MAVVRWCLLKSMYGVCQGSAKLQHCAQDMHDRPELFTIFSALQIYIDCECTKKPHHHDNKAHDWNKHAIKQEHD